MNSRVYLSQEKWTNLWKESLKVDYTPVVDVRRVKSKNKDFGKVIAETAKYTVKADDYLIKDEDGKIDEKLTDSVVETLDKALHRKRLVSFGFISYFAPALAAISPSPVASITTLQSINCLPDLLSMNIPFIVSPSI